MTVKFDPDRWFANEIADWEAQSRGGTPTRIDLKAPVPTWRNAMRQCARDWTILSIRCRVQRINAPQ